MFRQTSNLYLKWMKQNLERFGRVYTLDLLFADFIKRVLSMDTELRDNLRILRSTSFAIDVAMSARWQTARRSSPSSRLHSTLLPSFLSLSDIDVRRKCIHERLAAIWWRDVWRIHEKARFSVREERGGRGEKKKRKMKMRGKYRARGDSCANTWWEFALISTRLACSTRRRRCFSPRCWYFADTQREQRSSFAVDEKQYHGCNTTWEIFFSTTLPIHGRGLRVLESSIKNGCHNESLYKDIWYKYLSHVIYSFSYSDMTLHYEGNSFSNGKFFRNTSSRERQCQKWGSYRNLNSRKQLLCQWKCGLAKFTMHFFIRTT